MVGLLGVPGIVTLIAGLSTALSWLREPVALVAAPLAALLGALTCVTAPRAFESVGAALAKARRYREVMGVLVFVPLILLDPIISVIGSSMATVADDIPAIARVVSWTPFDAAWWILALGRPLEALAKAGIALATLGVLVLLRRRSLAILLVWPPRASGGSAKSKGLGPFNWLPATPTGGAELALGIAALATGELWLSGATLVVGVLLGSALMLVGIRRGGALIERRGPELLTSLRRAGGRLTWRADLPLSAVSGRVTSSRKWQLAATRDDGTERRVPAVPVAQYDRAGRTSDRRPRPSGES
ncbi:MAG: transporter [Naasia sp.]|nr:transporter [Naasia sp.]